MKLFTKSLSNKLTEAGYRNRTPIMKLFTPWSNQTWLLTGEENGILYGYADLGMGCVEWGGIATKEEFESITGPFQLKIERDMYFKPSSHLRYDNLESLMGV
ncbi:MAG: DUF2958 domain-containing protein [bacterium]